MWIFFRILTTSWKEVFVFSIFSNSIGPILLKVSQLELPKVEFLYLSKARGFEEVKSSILKFKPQSCVLSYHRSPEGHVTFLVKLNEL